MMRKGDAVGFILGEDGDGGAQSFLGFRMLDWPLPEVWARTW